MNHEVHFVKGTKMKLPSHAQQQDAAESGPAHSERRIVNNQENVRCQDPTWADLSVEVDTESLQVDVPQQWHLPAVTMTIMMILNTDDDTDDGSTPEDAGRGGAGGGHVVEQLLHPHQTPGQRAGHLGIQLVRAILRAIFGCESSPISRNVR